MHSTTGIRCAIYTRKSSEEGLEQEFNSLDAQREACGAYIKSQQHEGWVLVDKLYADGGFSGGNMNRPGLNELMTDIHEGNVDIVVVYKVDRLSRSLADFSRMVDTFDKCDVSFVSITQQFNTSTSMGRLTLNVLLSFAQFEREVTGERIRDKIAASKKKGLWMGGNVPLGYQAKDRALIITESEADIVRHIYQRYLTLQSVKLLKEELDRQKIYSRPSKPYPSGRQFSRGSLYTILKNPVYIGRIRHKEKSYPGNHGAIIDNNEWNLVQKVLEKNRHSKYLQTNAKAPSLLSGLLFDECGHPFSPTHTRKKSRRYRYYVNQVKVQFKKTHPETLLRVPALPVEKAVCTEIQALLNNPEILLKNLEDFGLSCAEQQSLIEHAKTITDHWENQEPAEVIKITKIIVSRIVLNRNEITLHISRSGLIHLLLPRVSIDTSKLAQDDTLALTIPIQLKRCGLELKLIIRKASQEQSNGPHENSKQAIQDGLRKAILWNESLISGLSKDMQELAENQGVSKRYIAQIIKLAYLSPKIIRQILSGYLPQNLTLGKLKQHLDFDWRNQNRF